MASKGTKSEAESAKFALTGIDDVHEVFADGTSDLLLGTPLAKLTFHSVLGRDGDTEKRKAVVRIVIPTVALIEFAAKFVSAIAENREVITKSGEESFAQLKAQLDRIPKTTANSG